MPAEGTLIMKTTKRIFVLVGLLLFFALCLVPSGEAQACLPISSTPSAPEQVGMHCTFTSSSSGFVFRAPGTTYWSIYFVPFGTVSAATLSLDSSATGLASSFSTGGVIPSSTIGPMTSVGSYLNTTATSPTEFVQLTPSITGTGQVSVTVFGFHVNPVPPGGGSGGTVAVSSLPALAAGTAAIGTTAPSLSSGAPVTGQQSVTASAVALPSTSLTRPVCLFAPNTNSTTVYYGPSGVTTSTGFPLLPGASMCGLTVANLNQIFVIASTTGSSVSYSAQ
jgi:hypothetical protein